MFGSKSIYGLQEETLNSLILGFLPPLKHEYTEFSKDNEVDDTQSGDTDRDHKDLLSNGYLFKEILKALRNNAGFCIPKVRGLNITVSQKCKLPGLKKKERKQRH